MQLCKLCQQIALAPIVHTYLMHFVNQSLPFFFLQAKAAIAMVLFAPCTDVLRSWAPKVLMCQATRKIAIGTNRSCRSIHSFHYMTRERLGTLSLFLHSFLSFSSRESGYRCSVFAGTKAWHIRIYGAQLRTTTGACLRSLRPS